MRFLPSRNRGEISSSLLPSLLSYRIALILGLMALFQDGRNFLKCLRCTFGHWRCSVFYFLNSSEQENWIWGGYNFPSNQFKYGRVIPNSYSMKDCWNGLKTWATQSRGSLISQTQWLEKGLLIIWTIPRLPSIPATHCGSFRKELHLILCDQKVWIVHNVLVTKNKV